MWVVGFYAPLLPILLPIAVGGLIFTYWVDKYLMKTRFSRPKLLGPHLNNDMIGNFNK